MVSKANTPQLALPRFVPFVLKDTLLAVWYDRGKNQYRVLCPQCHTLVTYDTLGNVYHEMVLGTQRCCQGCRAKATLEQNPGLIGLFLDFWTRTGNFPESTSWLEGIPRPQISLWEKEIKSALMADPEKRTPLPAEFKSPGQKETDPPLGSSQFASNRQICEE